MHMHMLSCQIFMPERNCSHLCRHQISLHSVTADRTLLLPLHDNQRLEQEIEYQHSASFVQVLCIYTSFLILIEQLEDCP